MISRIIYNVLDEQQWIEYLNADDPAIIETLKLFKAGEAFPMKTEDEKDARKVAKAFDYRATHRQFRLVAVG